MAPVRVRAHNRRMRTRLISCLLVACASLFGGVGCGASSIDAGPGGDPDGGGDDLGLGDVREDSHPIFGDGASDAKSDAKTDGAGAACPGVGARCGGALGLDPNKLYQCKDGVVGGVARDCTAPCLIATDGTQDTCPCPEGDGRYCGERVGGEKNKLYDCKAGRTSEAAQCAPTCTVGAGPSGDKCAPCTAGNGAYCGAPVGADPNTLFTCTDGALSVKQKCGAACKVNPPGTPDTCGPCPSGDGVYCGAPVGLDPNELYDCKAGVFTPKSKCGSTCHVAPAGTNDFCEGTGLLCSNVQWWNSALTYGPYMSYGWWDTDLAVSDRSPVQLRHDSQLYKENVYAWGWMPEFVDQVTGKKFRFLHLHPDAKYTLGVGTVYPAGTVVGLSGGGSADTGLGTYSTGAHLCVQTLDDYRAVFPTGTDACH
ncbi:MAG: hypothetical protein NVS3B10_16360 [Polyangiales bacterium]